MKNNTISFNRIYRLNYQTALEIAEMVDSQSVSGLDKAGIKRELNRLANNPELFSNDGRVMYTAIDQNYNILGHAYGYAKIFDSKYHNKRFITFYLAHLITKPDYQKKYKIGSNLYNIIQAESLQSGSFHIVEEMLEAPEFVSVNANFPVTNSSRGFYEKLDFKIESIYNDDTGYNEWIANKNILECKTSDFKSAATKLKKSAERLKPRIKKVSETIPVYNGK